MREGFLLLTSTGLSAKAVAEKMTAVFLDRKKGAVAIVTTAAEGKENNKYAKLAREQFSTFGFQRIDFIDLESEPDKDLSCYDVIYVCGGDTFKLLAFAKRTGFGSSIKALLKRGGIYIGVSAGSIIVGSLAMIAEEVLEESSAYREDPAGLDIIKATILPHYSTDIESRVEAFETKYRVHIERVSDSQALLVRGGQKIMIE